MRSTSVDRVSSQWVEAPCCARAGRLKKSRESYLTLHKTGPIKGDLLPCDIKNVWNFLRQRTELAGFVLIGGTALVLRINHRTTKDLDFAFPEFALPRDRIEELIKNAKHSGLIVERDDRQIDLDEALNAGMDLHDFQQFLLVDRTVKLSFFAPHQSLCNLLAAVQQDTVRVATLAELFNSKCLSSAKRSNSRDWLDLYFLLQNYGFTYHDYRDAFRQADEPGQMEISLNRLCSALPQRGDPGYTDLLPSAPSLEEMRGVFLTLREHIRTELCSGPIIQHSART